MDPSIINAIVSQGGYAALCVMLVWTGREQNKVIAENTAAVSALCAAIQSKGLKVERESTP